MDKRAYSSRLDSHEMERYGVIATILWPTNWAIEKCFITSTESSSVLTISGFYYISMRRSDGRIEGFYHDPSACPYQRLNLMPEKPMFPVYTFT